MNEKNKFLGETYHTPACCESDGLLVAYLYGEASTEEANRFEHHLTTCAGCRDELAQFGGVRRAIGEWRDAALRPAQSLVFEPARGVDSRFVERPATFAAAFRALKEFFTVSPLWLKTSTALATLAVCALAIFALFNAELRWNDNGVAFSTSFITRERIETQNVPASSERSLSQTEIDELVARRVEREVQERLSRIENSRGDVPVNANHTERPLTSDRNGVLPSNVSPRENVRRRSSPLAPQSERPQEVVRRDSQSDIEPPRLYDLLGELQ